MGAQELIEDGSLAQGLPQRRTQDPVTGACMSKCRTESALSECMFDAWIHAQECMDERMTGLRKVIQIISLSLSVFFSTFTTKDAKINIKFYLRTYKSAASFYGLIIIRSEDVQILYGYESKPLRF